MDSNSIVDQLKIRHIDSSFQNRKRIYYNNYGDDEEYTGSSDQNRRMLRDLKNGDLDCYWSFWVYIIKIDLE